MDELIEVAFVGDEPESVMVQALLEQEEIPSLQQRVGPNGLPLAEGLLNPTGGARRIMVHAHRAEEARSVIAGAEAAVEDFPEPVNARYLAEAQGGRLRSYGWIGAYARIVAVSIGAMALAFGVFTLVGAIT
jgi:hypothetical protein